jgi:hypothetical protein
LANPRHFDYHLVPLPPHTSSGASANADAVVVTVATIAGVKTTSTKAAAGVTAVTMRTVPLAYELFDNVEKPWLQPDRQKVRVPEVWPLDLPEHRSFSGVT